MKEKIKASNLERRGVEYPTQCKQVREKAETTNLDRYGVKHPLQSEEIRKKVRATVLERYGVEYASQSQEIKEKTRSTCLKKYGVEYAIQDPEIAEKCSKNSYTTKPYTFPSGNTINVQGYEPKALNDLLKLDYTEEDLITGCQNVPRISYTDSTGKERFHFPDIFIPKENRLIEVKSTWTFQKENVLLKKEFAEKAGYTYEIWIYDSKGNKQVV